MLARQSDVPIFATLMRERFEEVIEHATGRTVIGFVSGNQQHPDTMREVFILAPTNLVDAHEIRAKRRPRRLVTQQDGKPERLGRVADAAFVSA